MSGFTLLLGFLSLIISLIAIKIAKESDRKMKALADSQINEKLAIFAKYLDNIEAILESMDNGFVCKLNDIRSVNHDFNAVSDLKDYASDKKKKELIIHYLLPILKNLYSMKERYQKDLNSMDFNDLKKKYYPEYRIDPSDWGKWNDILSDLTKTTLAYDIETETIRNIIND